MTIYKYVTDLTKEELNKQIVIPCLDDEGFRTILIKSSSQKKIMSIYSTKYLKIQKNVVLYHNDDEYYFHMISCREASEYLNHNFNIIYEFLFRKIDKPIDEITFSELLYSIEELFSKATSNIENLQIGVAGELITLLYLHKLGVSGIFNAYHKNSYSKHDIELTNSLKIEVKTTLSEKRIHRFSHNQVNNKAFDIYISSVILYKVENGLSLYKLFTEVVKTIDDYDTVFSLKKQMNYCNVDDVNQGIVFAFENSLDSVKIMKAKDIPQIDSKLPKGVSNLSYDSSCDMVQSLKTSEITKIFKGDQDEKSL